MRKSTLNAIFFIALIGLVAVASAALPAQVTANIAHPGTLPAYWTVDITSGGNVDLPNSPPLYPGWCSDSIHSITTGTHTFDVYSSLEPNPAPISPLNWQKINYVMNHKGAATKYDIQAVIWYYDGGPYPWGSPNPSTVSALITAADTYLAAHPGYAPGPGDVYGVVLWSGERAQSIVIEVPIPYSSPEFPSLALPVGMVIGVVFALYIAKREN